MQRGEVWWADIDTPSGRRPVLLLSRDESYAVRSQCIVGFVTTQPRGIDAEVRLGTEDGMPRDCVVNLDAINAIELRRLDRQITLLSAARMLEVENAIHFALALET